MAERGPRKEWRRKVAWRVHAPDPRVFKYIHAAELAAQQISVPTLYKGCHCIRCTLIKLT